MELELKLQLADPRRWSELLSALPIGASAAEKTPRRIPMEARYFDTPGRALQKAKMALRVRREGASWVATVKTDGSARGGLHQRGEWNVPVAGPDPDPGHFEGQPIAQELKTRIGGEALLALYVTRFDRYLWNLRLPDDSLIELAADRGHILVNGKRRPILEVELELKSGTLSGLLEAAARLAAAFPLRLESRSKLHRALLLAGECQDAAPSLSALPELPAATSATAKAASLLRQALHDALSAEAWLLRNPRDKSGLGRLHESQFRLLGLLHLFKPLLAQAKQHIDALEAWHQGPAQAMQIAAMAKAWKKIGKHMPHNAAAPAPLSDLLARRHQKALQDTLAAAKMGRFTAALLTLWTELEKLAEDTHDERDFSVFLLTHLQALESRLGNGFRKNLEQRPAILATRLDLLESITLYLAPRLGMAPAFPKPYRALRKALAKTALFRQTSRLLALPSASRGVHHEAGFLLGWQARDLARRKWNAAKIWQHYKATMKGRSLFPQPVPPVDAITGEQV